MSYFRLVQRMIVKHPFFSIVTIATLALGVGANATIFSLADSVLLRPLPYLAPNQIVCLLATNPEQGIPQAGLAAGDFVDLRAKSKTLARLAAYTSVRFDWTGQGTAPAVIQGARVSPDLFPLLGIGARLGRVFLAQDGQPGNERVALISAGFWKRKLGADPQAIGRSLRLNGVDHRVVGVLPADFKFPSDTAEVFVPLAFGAADLDRRSHYLGAVGRLGERTSAGEAGEELHALAASLQHDYAATNAGWQVKVVPLQEYLVSGVRPGILALFVAVALVLVIACANVANLLLARGIARRRETAIRAAVGASRFELLGLFVRESLALSLCGAILGLGLAAWAVRYLVANSPQLQPMLAEIAVNRDVLIFALLLALAAGSASALMPGLQLTRLSFSPALRTDEAGGKGGLRLRSALVVGEMALALVLLTTAGLMLQTFLRLGKVPPGFRPENTLAAQISLSPDRYPEDPAVTRFYSAVVENLRRIPGLSSVSAASAIPLHDDGQNWLPFVIEGRTQRQEGEYAAFGAVLPGFFRTMGIRFLAGRDVSERDSQQAPPVVVINEVMARRYWPASQALGRHLSLTVRGDRAVSYEVIGIVGATRFGSLAEDPPPAVYVPFLQIPHNGMMVVARTSQDPSRVFAEVRRQVAAVDPNQPVYRLFPLADLVDKAGSPTRFYTALFLSFSILGLLLAAVGLYGLMAYSVNRQSREFAIRSALGASPSVLLRLVLLQGLKFALWGVAVGLLSSWATSRLVSSLLFGVESRDPATFAGVTLVLVATAFLASVVPAQRALRIHPGSALREA